MPLTLTSTAFESLETSGSRSPTPASMIPVRFMNRAMPGGLNVSIPYTWESAPEGTSCFALTLVDISPVAHGWVHWLVADIPPQVNSVAEGASQTKAMPAGAVELSNTFGSVGYGGPQPPSGTGTHSYVATIYALDVDRVDLQPKATIGELLGTIQGHVLASATCTGFAGR